MKIFEEKVSNGVDEVEYRVKVTQFRDRMNKWKPGRKINNLSPFFFMDCLFELHIYPNGEDTDSKGYVSIFLISANLEDLYVSYELSMGDEIQFLENQKIESLGGFGRAEFYSHDLEDEYDDNELEIVCNITKVMKDPGEAKMENQYQLTSKIRSDVEDLADSNAKVNEKVLELESDIKSRFNNVMQAQKEMQSEIKKKIDDLTKSMQELKNAQQHQQPNQQPNKFDDIDSDIQYNNIQKPKCVTCRSNLTSTSQIFQCPTGHLLCLICKNISGKAKCPSCHEPITRATGLESYLKILFPITAENFEFLSNNSSSQNISNVE